MRFQPATGLAIAGAMVVALSATACSSGSSSSSTTTPTTTSAPAATTSAPAATPSATVSGNAGTSGAAAQITTNWEKFFNPSTSTAERVALLQNGSAFSSAISSFSSNPLASGIQAKVLSVDLTSTTQATVKYDIDSSSGTALLANQSGVAVLTGSVWQVGDASFCGLLTLAGTSPLPSACSS
jgi:hypothetical protein